MKGNFTLAQAVLITGGDLVNCTDPEHVKIDSLSISSDQIVADSLFIAIRGKSIDGHQFTDKCFENGSIAAVVEDRSVLKGRPGIVVDNSRKAVALLSAEFYQNPSDNLLTVGVTGTNGKTTTNWIIYHLLKDLYGSAIRIGTLGTEFINGGVVIKSEEGNLTSPDAISISKILFDGLNNGVKCAVLEVSSIGLDQFRTDGVSFDGIIFTNLTRDHLDYHGNMEDYFHSKLRLFDLLSESKKKNRLAVVNIDDPYGKRIVERYKNETNFKIITFGRQNGADVRIDKVEQSLVGSQAELTIYGESIDFSIPLIGQHNIENASAAMGLFIGLGHPVSKLIEVFKAIPQVPGRLESVGFDGMGIYVDYAHSPDALENVLTALRPITEGRLWVIFGCGGDRDRGKRPQMANVAAKLADLVVITSDNPRTEDPEAILADILASGIKAEIVQVDRRKAITETIMRAKPDDVILIAGKGHENYQIIGTTKHHFSDVEEVKRLRDTI